MGAVLVSALIRSDHSARASDRGRPIGSTPSYLTVSARRSLMKDGVVCFGEEEPLRLFPGVLRSVTLVDGRPRGVLRYELKASVKGDPPAPRERDCLVVTERPYGNGWFAAGVFRPGAHRSVEERTQVDVATVDEALALLAKRSADPWETGPWLTAAIQPPNPLSVFDEPQRSNTDARWLFGVCEDHERFARELMESREASELLRLAGEGRLRLGPNQIPVHPRVADDANAVLFASANQALAGPQAANDLVGEPAMTLVKMIFNDHLYNRTRRALREDGHNGPLVE